MHHARDIDVSLARKVAFLQRPEAYPMQTSGVELIETHMAYVFLTDQRAYKLKKPVKNSFRDFSTVAARRRSCEDEVRLNARLAGDVYLGVVPLLVDPGGRLTLRGHGRVVDWLVEMRRLGARCMFAHRLRRGQVRARDIRAIGRTLARFYQRAERVAMTARAYRRRLSRDIRDTCEVLAAPHYRLPVAEIHAAEQALSAILHHHALLFDARVEARRVVDGHGDLRPEHIFLERRPVIIDCIEFASELRVLDAVSDVAFLALECERLGAPRVGRAILDAYARDSGDMVPEVVVRFYLGQHALSRAKIAAWHVDDPRVGRPGRWLHQARQYLAMARRHARACV